MPCHTSDEVFCLLIMRSGLQSHDASAYFTISTRAAAAVAEHTQDSCKSVRIALLSEPNAAGAEQQVLSRPSSRSW